MVFSVYLSAFLPVLTIYRINPCFYGVSFVHLSRFEKRIKREKLAKFARYFLKNKNDFLLSKLFLKF